MSEFLRSCYHESAHALVARGLKRRFESVGLDRNGGAMRGEPLPPNASAEEIERALIVIFAGREGEKYVPEFARGHDGPWLTPGEMVALDTEPDGDGRPSDAEIIEHYRAIIGDEAVTRAQETAEELVERKWRVGHLERLADELMLHGALTASEIEALLAVPA